MHNTRHHQVSQVICLKVQPIGKSSFFILVTYFRSNDRLFMLILQCMRVNPFIQFFDNNRRMYITICTLGFYDTSNKVIHQLIQFRIFVDSIDRSHSFHPLIHISVMERRSPMFTLAHTGSNLKITETVRDLRRVPSVPHTLQGSPAKYLKAISPESICPMYGTDSGIRHLRKTALTHIRQSIALRKCSRNGGGS